MCFSEELKDVICHKYLKDCTDEIEKKFPVFTKIWQYIPYNIGDEYRKGLQDLCVFLLEKGAELKL